MLPRMSPPLERLTIDGFAGIKNFDLTVQPFTVLIGPQSVGKSIVAKLLFLFKSAPRDIYLDALGDTPSSPERVLLDRFQEALPSPTAFGEAAEITYSVGGARFNLKHTGKLKASWKMRIPDDLKSAHQHLVRDLQKENGDEGTSDFNDLVKEAYYDRVGKVWQNPLEQSRFVPAGRSFFSQLEGNAAAFLENASLDRFLSEFWKFLAVLKGRREIRGKPLPAGALASALAEQLLDGRYGRDGLNEYIHSPDGRKLPPKSWSSGQQEAQPLAMLLQRYSEGLLRSTSLYIEEPEAHLFPFSQRLITELIALTYIARAPRMQIFVITHSPYILTTVNNLLLAGQLYSRKLPPKQRKALREVTPEDRALLPGTVGAFYMDRDGCRSIIENDTGLIRSSAIDEVSGSLNDQFDRLLEIERP